ncbi:hypothetical protein G9A89_009348 [Geosiphon pyriformis]|nr:hypothetical protein G9A89_009348 [Geosiphon pyriformis]
MSSKKKTIEGKAEASTSAVVGAHSTIENKRKKIDENQNFIITDVNTCDASNPSRIPLKSELTQGKVDLVRILFFGESFIVIYEKIAFLDLDFHVGKSAKEDVDKEEFKTPGQDIASTTPNKEIKKWIPQQVIEFLGKKKADLCLIKEDLEIIETNRIAGQEFLSLTKEELMQ